MFEKCPFCGAWKLKGELSNHIGVCQTYHRAVKDGVGDE